MRDRRIQVRIGRRPCLTTRIVEIESSSSDFSRNARHFCFVWILDPVLLILNRNSWKFDKLDKSFHFYRLY